jgi:hypothetical protein
MKVSRILFFVALILVAVWVIVVATKKDGVEDPSTPKPLHTLVWVTVFVGSLVLFIPALIAVGLGY